MKKTWLVTLSALLFLSPVLAQRATVYSSISHDKISVSASSELKGFAATNAVDGSGMSNSHHLAHNLGQTMWISNVSTSKVRANSSTKVGVVWFMCEFKGAEQEVDFIQIWNHNQNQHTRRGLQKVYLEYSSDGKSWSLLRNGKLDYFVIPEAVGRKEEPASLSIETGGIEMKYVCITADPLQGNYYHDGNPLTQLQAKEMHQNVDYYGLSEVRFYNKKNVAISTLSKIDVVDFKPSQGYLKTPSGAAREFRVEFPSPIYCGGKFTIDLADRSSTIEIKPSAEGVTSLEGTFPVGYMEQEQEATIKLSSAQGNFVKKMQIPGARKWELYFLPHSHLDIGYTHRQNDVMELQMRNLEKAIELSARTKNYPEGSRYKWNAEATWTVDGYLKRYANSKKADQLIAAIRRGDIGLDATLGSILTGVSKQEELMHLFDDAHKISKLTGVKINTAMMSDVPGQSWGLVTAMAQNGVRYFSSGPNYVPTLGRLGSHGVGLYNLKWGDLPCWWQSQSGSEKILYWQAGKGYSMFHGWLMDKLSVCGTEPIWDYLSELEQKEYPYALTYMRYTIHGDNGPPDESMPEVIRSWNEKYDSPRFVIGTTKELFTEMERLYGDYLPTYAGDMTPIWEDGAASTARELAMNRESSERLNQAEILWSMNHSASQFPTKEMLEAWKYVVLFSEHTWGAAGSGPEPESKFTKELWAGKKLYADSANLLSTQIYNNSLAGLRVLGNSADYIRVFNTNLWPRTDVVTIETDIDLTAKMLESPSGLKIPVQRLSNGNWTFCAETTPPLSSVAYRIVPDNREKKAASMVNDNVIDNGRVRVVIDKVTGVISSFTNNIDKYEYASNGGLNDYIYSGRGGSDPCGVESVRSITLLDDGDVAATLRVESDAPGCRSLLRDVTVYRDIDRVDIVNTLDRLNIYARDNVRFVFPFNIPNPEVSMDLAMSEMHPEREQLVSANKNFYSILNGVSVSDIRRGVYLTSIDAPFVELGTMTADLFRKVGGAMGWLNAATVSPTVYSWVMNNCWGTNYKASQEGLATFRYSLQTFDPEQANLKKQGMEQAQKLVAVASNNGTKSESLFRSRGKNSIALSTIRPSVDGQGYIIRLQNLGPLTAHTALEWGALKVAKAYLCDNMENTTNELDTESIWLKPYDCVTIKITMK